uniref:Uncharacterized protein n=1 Tax=candidate division CPR3 bacterium TaxID=2268181 RepID=A0A7C4R307_UNCC3
MSKKNKAFKQLLKSQIQTNANAVTKGKDIVQSNQSLNPNNLNQNTVSDKEANELTMIRKDIKLSIILSLSIVFILLVIYFVDKSNPFLLSLANSIFDILQK